ncbi:ribosome small subunit-dependent GTPase A [uncultured Shimia sp.]|uniref:ribosome small subunit-dependent GTPase A n=1 Tax=uncultured Shimia sp. TaxID=573152 RepID=UPI00261CB036|nr:ribosome small subunit-dependent GTPase A [uncultured Shimia sp.]
MTDLTLADLGWSAHFAAQIDEGDLPQAARISSVARDRLFTIGPRGAQTVVPPSDMTTASFAVGDWVVLDPVHPRVLRRLQPMTTLNRRAAGTGAEAQLIAANVDTLAIVTSCNADFNEARIERYLALAASTGCLPLVVLTKADTTDDPRAYVRRAERLSPLVTAIALNALDNDEAEALSPWCKAGQALALVGSSGVGKSTLANAMTQAGAETQGIREDDAKGRHTTTARGLHQTRFGGWLIDTPGMRALRLTDASEGIEAVFEDIETLARACRFSDCGHETEPGCAIRAALETGEISEDRLQRWRKLLREDAHNSATLHEARAKDKAFGKMVRSVMKEKHGRR